MHPRESGQQVKEAGAGKERKQSKGAIAGKASGKLQLIPQGNSGVDITSQSCPTKIPVQSYPDTCQFKH